MMNINSDTNTQGAASEGSKALDVFIRAMAYLAETRESGNCNRIYRTELYVKTLAKELKTHPRFEKGLESDKIIETLSKIAPLHDIGNVGIPDRILLKPGRLAPDEFDIIKSHTTIGRDIIAQAEHDMGLELLLPNYVKEIVYSHHEKWDGSGYPHGLSGDEIPISARLVMVVDVYDALISRRVYKPAITHLQATKVIQDSKGTHFDPDIVDAFDCCHDEFHRIAHTYSDTEKDFKKRIDYLEKAIAVEP
jgi:putative two-component system response regulator